MHDILVGNLLTCRELIYRYSLSSDKEFADLDLDLEKLDVSRYRKISLIPDYLKTTCALNIIGTIIYIIRPPDL